MNIAIEIDTLDRHLGFDLFAPSKTLGPGVSIEIPGGATLKLESMYVRKAAGVPETLKLVLTYGGAIATGLVANWLYGRLKGRTKKLLIDRVEITVDKGKIQKILIEKIETTE